MSFLQHLNTIKRYFRCNDAADQGMYEQFGLSDCSRAEVQQLVHKVILYEIQQRKNTLHQQRRFGIHMHLRYSLHRITGKALALLRSQFAKKPKNPV